MKLEIGPGFAKQVEKEYKEYIFNPKVTGDDVVYLDVNISKIRIVNFVVGDAHYLPFVDRCFEEVYASHLIEHLSDPMKFFRESYRVLHDAGQLLLWLPNFVTKGATEDMAHINVYNFLRLKREMEKAGFKCYFPYPKIGSKVPRLLRYVLKVAFLFFCSELHAEGKKMRSQSA